MSDDRTEWWIRYCAAKALDELYLPYQAAAEGEEMPEDMRVGLRAATNALLAVLPTPTGYAVIGSGTPRMYRREFSTMKLAREDAEALAKAVDHEHVTIRAVAPNLAWNVMRVKRTRDPWQSDSVPPRGTSSARSRTGCSASGCWRCPPRASRPTRA